jgi:acyl-coenzyme A thioesterase PaaI-like protein
MTGDTRRDDATAELAAELREVARALASCEISADGAEAAVALARDLRRALAGPPRRRWYEAGEPSADGPLSSRAYRDQSPLRGRFNPIAPPLDLETVETSEGPRVVGRARLGAAYEGPPHGVHGGFVAALFDDLLGAVQGLSPPVGVTAKLAVTYRHLTPIDEDLVLEGWIEEKRGRRLIARATCHAGDTLTAQAEGIFLAVDFDEIKSRMQERRAGADAG